MAHRSLVAVSLILAASCLGAAGRIPAHGMSSTPLSGSWGFCTDATQIGCIESLSLQQGSGDMRVYTTYAEAQSAGAQVSAQCSVPFVDYGPPSAGPLPACSRSSAPKSGPGSGDCGAPPPSVAVSVEMDYDPSGTPGSEFVGRRFVLRLRTGDFDPVFAMGGQIESTTRTKLDSGLFIFEVDGRIQTRHWVDTSGVAVAPGDTYRARLSEFLRTSKATSTAHGANFSVYAADVLKQTSLELGGTCVTMPFTGAFSDSNGTGFTTKWLPAKASDPEASTIQFEVSGPHFLSDSNGNDDKLVPARVRFFLPDEFFVAAGYTDPSKFDASRLLVTTRDGQKPTPTLTRRNNGVLVDFGISHYSAPDPVLKVFKFGATPTVIGTVAPTTTVPSPTSAVSGSASSFLRLSKGRTFTSSRLASAAGLKRPTGATVSLKVVPSSARYCKVVGTSVRGLRVGRCRVTVNVRLKGRTTAARTLTITVV